MSIDEAYTRWASTYDTDRNLTRDLDQSVTANLFNAQRFAFILEAGCGTGKNTQLFASIGDAVLALDFSSGMLDQAQRRVREPHIRFQQADLHDCWPCASGVAQLVSCNLVLEHIADLHPVFQEAARVLSPAGLLFVNELHPYRQYQGGQAQFSNASGDSIKIRAFTHHASDFVRAALFAGFHIEALDEWWHTEDAGKAPRLISFLFRKPGDES